MKSLFITALALSLSFSMPAFACIRDDTSKTLLVIAVSPDGEENKVIADINSDGLLEFQRFGYSLVQRNSSQIVIRSLYGNLLFNLNKAGRFGSFCYPVVFATLIN